MNGFILSVVLLSAFSHAAWNIFIKMGGDRLSASALMFFYTGLISLAVVPFYDFPPAAVWPYLVGSAFVHGVYVACLSKAYEIGDFTKVYPVGRGAAPLLSLLGAFLFAGEILEELQLVAIFLIIGGVVGLSLEGQKQVRLQFDKAVLLALLIAGLIGIYTLLDGMGARLYGSAPGYIAWIFILYGFPFAAIVWLRRGHAFVVMATQNSHKAFFAALISAGAYVAATWAMTQTSIGLVAALRETSVLFGLLLAHFVLRERFGWQRVLLSLVVLCGVVLLRL